MKWDVIEKFDRYAKEHLENICSEYAEWGYDYFYKVPDDIEDICEINGWEFSEEGKFIV